MVLESSDLCVSSDSDFMSSYLIKYTDLKHSLALRKQLKNWAQNYSNLLKWWCQSSSLIPLYQAFVVTPFSNYFFYRSVFVFLSPLKAAVFDAYVCAKEKLIEFGRSKQFFGSIALTCIWWNFRTSEGILIGIIWPVFENAFLLYLLS